MGERKRMGWRKALAVVIVGGGLGILLAEGPSGREDAAVTAEKPRAPGQGDVAGLAKGICRIAVPAAMNDPDSVEFDPSDSWAVTLGENHQHVVRLGLRAKNGFNATVHEVYDCFVEDRGTELEALRLVQVSP